MAHTAEATWRHTWAMITSYAAISLTVLVLQNSALVLMTRYSRMAHRVPYVTSTLVLHQEIVKMALCVVLLGVERGWSHWPSAMREAVSPSEGLLLVIPAALFTLQNFLTFVSLTYLDTMTFQMLSQSKLLSAAVFSVTLLDRRLGRMQWMALAVLTLGMYASQVDPHATITSGSGTLMGAAACVVSGISSSFAGVYFERVVKTTPPSLAVRNIQLSFWGIPLAAASMLAMDVIPVWYRGRPFVYWAGYDTFTWLLVGVHALGGLLVAAVVKYADNILKGFATAVAIIASGLYSAMAWGYYPSSMFVVGCTMVAVSTIMYGVASTRNESRGTARGSE